MRRWRWAKSDTVYAVGMVVALVVFATCLPFFEGNEFSAISDFLSLLAAFTAVWVSFRVWDTANRQTSIADSQLKVARGLADQELLPDVSVSIRSDPDVNWIATISIKNYGKRPALNLKIDLKTSEKEESLREAPALGEGQISMAEFSELIRQWKSVEHGFPYLDAGDERRSSLLPFRRIGPGQLTIAYSYEWKDVEGLTNTEHRTRVFTAGAFDGERYIVPPTSKDKISDGSKVIFRGTLNQD